MEKRGAKKWAVLILAAALVGALAGCGIAERPVGGSVTLRLNNVQAKSILPPISMAVADYLVSATGPSGSTIEPTVVAGTTTFNSLLPGAWSFTVVGRNAGAVAIGAGSGSINVVIGQTKPLTITVAEYAGNGSLDLDLGWEPRCGAA